MGRRRGGLGDLCSRRGLVQRDAPPIFFSLLRKRKRAVHGPKRKALARSGAVALRAEGGRRIGACSDLALPSGTLCSSAISPTAVPWRMAPTSSGGLSHGAASLFAAASCPARELPIKASAPTTARGARSDCASVDGCAALRLRRARCGQAERAEGGKPAEHWCRKY